MSLSDATKTFVAMPARLIEWMKKKLRGTVVANSDYSSKSILALSLWILLFAMGVLISSDQYKKGFVDGSYGSIGWSAVYVYPFYFFMSLLVYTPTNVCLLSIISGYIGACLRIITSENKILDDATAEHVPIPFTTSQSGRIAAYHRMLQRTRREKPSVSLVRGFIIFVFFASGMLLVTDKPFTQDPSVYMRFAGLMSIIAFVIGYDPTRFDRLISGVPYGKKEVTTDTKIVADAQITTISKTKDSSP